MTTCERLFVLWSDEADGGRHIVGELWREAGEFAFRYAESAAKLPGRGFMPLAEFPRIDRHTHTSRYLFPVFAQRIPSPKRPDFQRMMKAWRVERPDDVFE